MPKVYLCLSVLLSSFLLFAACSKKDSTTPTNNNNNTNNNNTTASPYYFWFTLNNSHDTINDAGTVQTYSLGTNTVIAGATANIVSLEPFITLQFSKPAWYDTVKESDVLGLSGKTIYFTDTTMSPNLEYQPSGTTDTWDSDNYIDSTDNIKIASITFLATDNYHGYPVRKYVITGTCKAHVMMGPGTQTPLIGTFKMLLIRVVW